MQKKNNTNQYYSLDSILERDAHYNLIIGERSNGKTYACLKYGLDRYINHGREQMAIIRRFREDFTGKRGAELFRALTENEVVSDLSDGRWNGIYYYGSRWFLARYYKDSKGNDAVEKDSEPFAFGFSITSMEHDKGSSYPSVKTIIFDEFITRTAYLPDEFVLFTNTLSTIIRQRNDVKIFMLGNTVNKYCPYFNEMGLKHIREMRQGDIDLYKIGDSGLKIAVEYCGQRVRKKKSDIYFSFDNPKLQMITRGMWELDVYPHSPRKYTKKDVVFVFFIDFDGELLQCEVVSLPDTQYLFIHRKTTELKDEEGDLIYSQKYDPRPNWRRSMLTDGLPVTAKILRFFRDGQVYYQDNEVGEVVRNFLQWKE